MLGLGLGFGVWALGYGLWVEGLFCRFLHDTLTMRVRIMGNHTFRMRVPFCGGAVKKQLCFERALRLPRERHSKPTILCSKPYEDKRDPANSRSPAGTSL